MKIVKLQAENVKRLKAVEITPDGNTVIISGKNGQGKTSILDSIWLALAGGEAAKGMPRPIRDGEKKANVTLDLGDLKVTRRWTDNDKSYLQVDNKDGATFKSPQKMLDALVGRLSFDPLAFAQQDEKAQLKTLQELVNIDPAPLEAKRKKFFDERTIINRDVSRLKAQLEGMVAPAEDVPAEEVSAADVLKELQAAQEQKTANDNKRRELQELKRKADGHKVAIESIDEQIKALQEKKEKESSLRTAVISQGKKLQTEIAALVDPDINSFQEKLNKVEETNKAVRNAKAYHATKADYEARKKESDFLTADIEKVDAEKESILKAAKFPVEGLGFDADGVTFNDIPFKQCSSAEKLRVSLAMAMSLNPKLRVIRITDGSLLDSGNMKLIEEMAKDGDFQVWIEKVDESGKLGVYIEDGEVANG